MSHVLKRASRVTIYPKNKYSKGYQEVYKMATEKKVEDNT